MSECTHANINENQMLTDKVLHYGCEDCKLWVTAKEVELLKIIDACKDFLHIDITKPEDGGMIIDVQLKGGVSHDN